MRKNLTQGERMELFGCLIDAVEDFLETKGLTKGNFPNEDREGDESEAIIFGADYDELADRFSSVLDLERDYDETKTKFRIVGIQYPPEEYLTFERLDQMSEYLDPSVKGFEILSINGDNAVSTFIISNDIMEVWDIDEMNGFYANVESILNDVRLENENAIYEYLSEKFVFLYV